jgi:hypothetical protein
MSAILDANLDMLLEEVREMRRQAELIRMKEQLLTRQMIQVSNNMDDMMRSMKTFRKVIIDVAAIAVLAGMAYYFIGQ